jgi:hypothetical protein
MPLRQMPKGREVIAFIGVLIACVLVTSAIGYVANLLVT